MLYKEHGPPLSVVRGETFELSTDLAPSQVLVKMLGTPINPSDINQIEGVYPKRPPLPAIGGNEGVAEVLRVGNAVTKFKPGDWVLPSRISWGTWRSHAVDDVTAFWHVPSDIGVQAASSISVNPCTALRMLKDFVPLQAGDTVIQNGANSGVGLAVIQIAKALGIRTINIVRERDDFNVMKEHLVSLGADHVVTESFARTPAMLEIFKQLPRPKLGFNCIGGKSALSVMRLLQEGGHHVTYGGMSKEPVTVPTGALIFNDIHFHGYWNSRWKDVSSLDVIEGVFAELAGMVRKGQLDIKLDEVPAVNYQEALTTAMSPGKPRKIMLTF